MKPGKVIMANLAPASGVMQMSVVSPKARIGIVGGTGYTGVELLRLLARHSGVQVEVITSRSESGMPVADLFPSLRGHVNLRFSEPDVASLSDCDLVFFATPHNVAMKMMPALLAAGIRAVDLSADFRIRDVTVWEHWYKESHACPDLLQEAVYGLPEMYRDAIRDARLVACAGCYPTAVQLGFMPVLEAGLADTGRLIASAASGASGAGRQAKLPMLLTEAGESFKAYGASGHRHLPEMEQGLSAMAERPVALTFVPHLAPMVRGIHAALFVQLTDPGRTLEQIQTLYESRYADEPFVDVMPLGSHPETRYVKGANDCRIALHRPGGGDTLVVLSVIDNLVKGAAGQAIQAMNIMLGLDERTGLEGAALLP